MKGYLFNVLVLVFVTSNPQYSDGQFSDIGTQFTRVSTRDSKIIRFYGNSFIRYTFDVLPSDMLAPSDNETISLQFITKSSDGLIWIYKGRNGQKMHISMKDSSLIFVYDDGRGSPQTVRVPHPDSRALNDFRWHSVKLNKEGRVIKFYIDGKYATQLTTRNLVHFINDGELYLGGVLNARTETGGVVDSSFNGALTDVEAIKTFGTARELVLSFLKYVDSAEQEGDISIFDPDVWNNGTFIWETTRAPPVTPAPILRTPVTFKTGGSVFYLRDPLDMRSGGSLAFRFRTLEPRGLLVFARGNSQGVNFFAIEMFDGILYFVYDLGSLTSRLTFTDSRVDDGVWHDVKMNVQNGRMTLELDGKPMVTPLTQQDMMYYHRLYIGGFNDFTRIPWPIYSRQGYKGCMDTIQINNLGVDLHREVRNSRPTGVSIGCSDVTRFCQKQPCISGSCQDRMNGYVCNCANTQYTGDNCNNDAIIGSWDGNLATTYNFINRELTHTNDISFRFRTLMDNTILFRTEADGINKDFIRAEIVNGKAQVTLSVDGRTKVFQVGNALNDYLWHTLYLRRRADDVEIWVDDDTPTVGLIGGENYKLQIDRIKFGAVGDTGSLKANNYIGYLQNFMYDDTDLFEELKSQGTNHKWIINMPFNKLPLLTYKPVTLTTSDTFFQLPYLRIGIAMKLMMKFKTRESNGLILYNAGRNNDVIALELSNGQVRLAYNLGGQNMFTMVPTSQLNDNNWHTVVVSLNDKGQFTLTVDGETMTVSTNDGDGRLDLSGSLYIGGLPAEMFQRREVSTLIESRKGFRGCLASVDLNGQVPDLVTYSRDRSKVLYGCTDLEMVCQTNACGTGVCVPGINDYWCNCNMTGYVGTPCTDMPIGYYFGKNGDNGIMLYEYPFEKQANSDVDQIAFGFMTREENGVLYRIESSFNSKEFIEISLVDGFIQTESNTGNGIVSVSERSRKFNDGNYHVVRYVRTGSNTTLRVDSLPMQTVAHTGGASVFNKVYRVILGGRTDARGAMTGNFYGIMGGAYYNGNRWFDMASYGTTLHGKNVIMKGDVVLTRPFILVSGGGRTTAAPPDIVIPPDEVIPDGIGGGGFVLEEIGGAGGGGGPGVIGIGGPGGGLTSISGVSVAGSGNPVPLAVAGVGPVPPALAGGARAGAVVGTLLGTLAFMTSLMWALYKLKPGVPALLSPGAGSAGGGAGMSISAPRATSNLGAVQAASAGAGSGGAGSGAGAGATKVTVVNGSAAGGGGGGSSTYTSYFQSTNTAVQGAGGTGGAGSGMAAGHADAVDSSTLRATGTFSNKGTAIGSPTTKRAHLGSSSTGYSSNYQSNTMQSYGGGSMAGGGTMDRGGYSDKQFMSLSSAGGGDNIPDYDMPMPGTLQSGYSSSTLNTHYNYQVQNYKTVTVNKQGQYMMTTAGGGAVTPGAAADEVRVDCCLMTSNGGSVITGSSLGPPQVWDMQTGELQNIMKGDTIGSTNLHLVCGDRLLVGAVHADMEINEYSSRKGVFNHTLQIWDFQTGRPLSMAEGEYCSAMCPMSDSDKVLFGRTDKFGDATSIIAWDLMGNQAIKEMRYDAPVGNNDYISYLNKSKNDRYIIAGYTNSFDNNAEFMTFDMTLTSYNISEPTMLKLDANPEVTAILPRDEAVTGLRNGDLQIWNIRTGQLSRRLMGGGGSSAHSREIKSVTLSEDSRYLVSTSADGTVKVWDMQTERPVHTLQGHSDEVWCSAISNDNEIVVSGSADGTIRLWRMKNGTEMCTFNCGVDIFYVTMSRDKGTIVALGDKYGARKLIMLQVVRTKIKKIVSS